MPPRGPSHALGFGQVQQQRQSLTITPQLRQAIELLQLTNLELAAFLDDAVEANPLLSREDGLRSENGDAPAGGVSSSASSPLSGDPREDPGPASDTDDDNLWNGDDTGGAPALAETVRGASARAEMSGAPPLSMTGASGPGRMRSGSGAGEFPDLTERIAETPTLGEVLQAQILMAFDDPADRLIAVALAGRLDSDGYLREDPVDAAAPTGASATRILAVYRRLRTLEPVGIFARDLADCLEMQLAEADLLDPSMQALIDNLDLLAAGDQRQLLRLCDVLPRRLGEMVATLRQMDPRPASRYDATPTIPVVPDLLVEDTATGWQVRLNPSTQPRLLIDKTFAESVRRSRDPEGRRYIGAQLREANWLVRALEQRARTLVRVGAEIVRHQQVFFDKGIEGLRPLVLRQIADAIDMHESTVSRATAGKYIETPRGVFEMKFFFSAAVGGDAGEAQAAMAIRHRIRSLIENETTVLSDDKIVQLLRQAGFDVARRTVAKYRDAMRIPSSVERRRQKVIALAG